MLFADAAALPESVVFNVFQINSRLALSGSAVSELEYKSEENAVRLSVIEGTNNTSVNKSTVT